MNDGPLDYIGGGALHYGGMPALSVLWLFSGLAAAQDVLRVTLPDGAEPSAPWESSARCEASTSAAVVVIDPAAAGQPIDGFGASMTESSALVLESLPSARRREALDALFGERGAAFDMVRVPVGASDFSTGDYSCDDPPAGETDARLRHFSFERCMRNVLPYLRAARGINPRVRFMASPWSAPAWMKSSGTMRNGSLEPEWYDAYARYLVRFASESARAGAPLSYLTVVNEPGYGTDGYPSMVMTSTEQARFIGKHLGPGLAAAGLSDVKILAFDHNWSSASYPAQVLSDRTARRYTAGSAFHCYEGSPDMMAPLAKAHPDKEIHFTECSAGVWSGPFAGAFGWAVRNLVIGNLRHGARSVQLWNLALDDAWGPTNNGCLECRGVITVLRSSGTFTLSPEYHAMVHARLAAPPGARRVGSETAAGSPEGLEHVAFAGPDGRLGLVAFNASPRELEVQARYPGGCRSYRHPAGAAATLAVSQEKTR